MTRITPPTEEMCRSHAIVEFEGRLHVAVEYPIVSGITGRALVELQPQSNRSLVYVWSVLGADKQEGPIVVRYLDEIPDITLWLEFDRSVRASQEWVRRLESRETSPKTCWDFLLEG